MTGDAGLFSFDLGSISDEDIKIADAEEKLSDDHAARKNTIEFEINDPYLLNDMEIDEALSSGAPQLYSSGETDGIPRIYLFDELPDFSDINAAKKKATKVIEIKDPVMVKFMKRSDERFAKHLRARGIPEGTDLRTGYEEENAEYEKIQLEEFERISAETDERR